MTNIENAKQDVIYQVLFLWNNLPLEKISFSSKKLIKHFKNYLLISYKYDEFISFINYF